MAPNKPNKRSSPSVPAKNHAAADRLIRQKFQLARSPAWPKVEKKFRAAHPQCAACGETGRVNVHHMFPFHYVVLLGRPDLELDPRNLMTLCVRPDAEHHLLLGHLDDYESYNPNVKRFVRTYAARSSQKIRAYAAFQKARAAKPKHVDQMTAAESAAFKKMLDAKFPAQPAIAAKAAKARSEGVPPRRLPAEPTKTQPGF